MDQHFWDKWPIIFYSIRHYGAVLPQMSKSNCNDFLQLNSSNQKRSNHHFVVFQLHLFSYTHLNIITGLQTHQAGSQTWSHTLFWLAERQLYLGTNERPDRNPVACSNEYCSSKWKRIDVSASISSFVFEATYATFTIRHRHTKFLSWSCEFTFRSRVSLVAHFWPQIFGS